MTHENGEGGITALDLVECDCVYFKALSPSDQKLNRRFREKIREAISGMGMTEEIVVTPGAENSMCGQCIRRERTINNINMQIGTLRV